MKNYLYISLLALTIASCKTTDDQSDAYGNFEAESVIVSAETSGKVVGLDLEEGETISKGLVYVVVDTTQATLNIAQIAATKESVNSKKDKCPVSGFNTGRTNKKPEN